MDEVSITRVLARDYSAGTEALRDALLGRCLEEIDKRETQGVTIDDDELDLLAAAGSPELLARLGMSDDPASV